MPPFDHNLSKARRSVGKGGENVIKGCQKRIIHITNTGSPYFEEAYFILKNGGEQSEGGGVDIVKEAKLLVDSASRRAQPAARRRRRHTGAAVLTGAAVCSFVFGIVMLIFMLGARCA